MELRKRIPARTHVEKFNRCITDFMEMSQEYRDIRARFQNKMDSCHWCKRKFVDGEMMALAQPTKGKNKVLCLSCAYELLKTKEGIEYGHIKENRDEGRIDGSGAYP